MNKYLSKKEYLKKHDSNVGYALYVQNNIKKDDYARLNTGEIVRVIGIKENKSNKKAIYYGVYEQDWFDSMAVENFSDKPIDLIEVGDYVNGYKVIGVTLDPAPSGKCVDIDCDKPSYESYLFEEQIYSIVTKEQFASMEYKVEEEQKQ